METEFKTSFITVNFKGEKYIPRCFSSIRKNCPDLNFEIILVNNGDSRPEIADAKIINLEKNLGFGNACNQGAKIAQGEILCFLNSDTEILDNIKKVADLFDNDKGIGIIGPKLITSENKTQYWCAGLETNFWDLVRNKLGYPRSKKIWNSDKSTECDWVSGASLFIRKDIFEKLGGFDEKFFMYFEDMDLCKRARNLGYKVLYFPDWNVKHFGGKSFSSKFKQKRLYYSSLIYYFKKTIFRASEHGTTN
jgi:GT2 family glycosyltransferase